jgi:hypothetical protein
MQPPPRALAVVTVVCALVLAGALPPAQAAERALPETVVVHDSRTSDPAVDIAQVTLYASWYWDSQQGVGVKVPHGFRPGHLLTVWFDLDGDSTPDGHYELRLDEPGKKGGKLLKKTQEFRLGGGWTHGGELVRCTDSEGFRPVSAEVRRGQRSIGLGLDLWGCLHVASPAGTDSGSWRAAVRLAKGKQADMAPNGQKWSAPVAGWGPCDPSGGSCS